MDEDSRFSHKIYKSDPLLFKTYVGMEVNIVTEDGTATSGVVYTVDPVSERLGSLMQRVHLFPLYLSRLLLYHFTVSYCYRTVNKSVCKLSSVMR